MSIIVHTARMQPNLADWLDITRKGAEERPEPGGHRGIGAAFAPSRRLLNTYLRQRTQDGLTDQQWLAYADAYKVEMRRSYVALRHAWDRLLSWEHVVCTCYCRDPTQCHRTILAREIMPKLGAKYMGEL
ncbi:MAG TPA: DUF488 family protein [Polyangiaceae bacterium]|nr:DUF488 family protein [Polyangiaceae bacterium]